MTALRASLFPLVLVTFAHAFAQAPLQPAASDVDKMLRQAREEIRSFEAAGGKKSDPNHPVGKWVLALWAFREKSPGTPEAAKATSEAVHLLIHADRFQEAQARADQIASGDAAWQGLSQVLFEAASIQRNFTYFFQKLRSVLPNAPDPKVQAAIQLSLGRAWRAQPDDEKAKQAFQAAIELARESPSGRQAETELYELLHLGPGQPAPEFSTTAVNGSHISLADYRGKPLVLVFWSTH
jgi:tetratricopeptide (TPR) repeat protein